MSEEVGPGGDQARAPLVESQRSLKDVNQENLQKMTDYKSYAKVLRSFSREPCYISLLFRVSWILPFSLRMLISFVMLWNFVLHSELS